MALSQNLWASRGHASHYEFKLYGRNRVAYPLTGHVMRFVIQNQLGSGETPVLDLDEAEEPAQVVVTDRAAGEFVVKLSDTDLTLTEGQTYVYGVLGKTSGRLLVSGDLTIEKGFGS